MTSGFIQHYKPTFIKLFSFSFQVTILFVGIFVTGVIGNLIVCIVIVRHASMHTATNYYLFSLAVSDLIFLIFGKYFYLCYFSTSLSITMRWLYNFILIWQFLHITLFKSHIGKYIYVKICRNAILQCEPFRKNDR